MYRISEDKALVQTLDFLTPVVNDPYVFGQIAAANSLSDVYAMGGTPLTAMNIVCFPSEVYPGEILKETLRGGLDKIHEAGAVLVGGHSVEDSEFKYGLSVTGLVHPGRISLNSGARIKDILILTKPIGTGIIATAVKGSIADENSEKEMIEVMTGLNKYPLDILKDYDIGGCTDITGFGLAGHLMEMAKGAGKKFLINSGSIPVVSQAKNFADMGLIPAGAYRNRNYCRGHVFFKNKITKSLEDIIFDPQTSGGLVASVRAKDSDLIIKKMKDKGINAEIIGEVIEDNKDGIIEIS